MRHRPQFAMHFLMLLCVIAAMGCGRGASQGERAPEPIPNLSSEDEGAIRDLVRNQTDSWNRHDATAFSRDFAQDGIYTNVRGESLKGYDAFFRQHEQVFRTVFRTSTLSQEIAGLTSPEPGVALVESLTSIAGLSNMPPGITADSRGRMRTRLLQVLVKRGGLWKVVAHHNVDVKPGVQIPDSR